MAPTFARCPANPIVTPGLFPWRMATVFNPGVLYEDGRFFLYERAAGSLRPFICSIGLLESADGVRFRHASDQPVFTPEMAGSRHGSVQDPRVVKLGDTYYMTYAFRPYAWHCYPTGLGVPESHQPEIAGVRFTPEENQTRSGIAVSRDRVHWEHLAWATPPELDDRDVILFPEKIGGRFAILRRPLRFVGTDTGHGGDLPAIRISFSDDLLSWTPPEVIALPEQAWEGNRIGGSTPPIRTEAGWLVLYHGVEDLYPTTRRVCYRVGAMLLDLADPRRVLARTRRPLMEPEAYYEKFGLYIPNVIFPTGNVVKDGLLWLYYGVCDTAIALATVPLDELVEHLLAKRR
ncbi:MAG TPA: glycosidase [Planctomycetota bacterium]|nr:glycosidase [Planctomycetota bacterium]HRR79415.1 glycosidase [Planctomycetota bacterium]HRT93492.1 glycosidase [Planctomycetota bacterium]